MGISFFGISSWLYKEVSQIYRQGWEMLELWIGSGLESEYRVMICLSESSRERIEVSHVIVECRVINHRHISILRPRELLNIEL